jgi:hypothetical protein
MHAPHRKHHARPAPIARPVLRLVTRTRRKQPRIRTQPRIPGTRRLPIGSAIDHAIERALNREMLRYGVSRSFVVAVALAYTFGIELDENADYHRKR